MELFDKIDRSTQLIAKMEVSIGELLLPDLTRRPSPTGGVCLDFPPRSRVEMDLQRAAGKTLHGGEVRRRRKLAQHGHGGVEAAGGERAGQ